MVNLTDQTVAETAAPLKEQPHWLPCSIKHDGKAAVQQYFQPATEDSTSILQASFRGRLLRGRVLPLPEGYVGQVISQRPAQQATTASVSSGTFDSLVYWNHELQPSRTDPNSRAMEWLQLASQMHAPVSPDAVESELEAIMSKGYQPAT